MGFDSSALRNLLGRTLYPARDERKFATPLLDMEGASRYYHGAEQAKQTRAGKQGVEGRVGANRGMYVSGASLDRIAAIEEIDLTTCSSEVILVKSTVPSSSGLGQQPLTL